MALPEADRLGGLLAQATKVAVGVARAYDSRSLDDVLIDPIGAELREQLL